VFVLTESDYARETNPAGPVSRDNIFIEAGMALGMLGRRRTVFVVEASARNRLPSDLAGVTVALFDGKQQNLRAAVGPAVAQIKEAVGKYGRRSLEVAGGTTSS
ncbi:MAG TPA: TIR domain-containing protein, partial [Myxococcales bacterium]|nr:TIR domain-containing protein [Myxococcales bacterium]